MLWYSVVESLTFELTRCCSNVQESIIISATTELMISAVITYNVMLLMLIVGIDQSM